MTSIIFKKIVVSISTLTSLLGISKSSFFELITCKKAKKLISSKKDLIILDIRTPEEYEEGHIEDSVLIDFYDALFTKRLNVLDKNKTYLIYCRSGHRSALALSAMKDLGFKKVYDLDGGFNTWNDS
jgi:rhodanese-related sulfurtransferase